jgi:hypothetical protein
MEKGGDQAVLPVENPLCRDVIAILEQEAQLAPSNQSLSGTWWDMRRGRIVGRMLTTRPDQA